MPLQDAKTLILSDLHLGYRSRPTPLQLRTLWQPFDRLILNGDIAEVARPKYQKRANNYLRELQGFVQEDQVELKMISGNHDPRISDLHYLSSHDSKLLITHGDIFHPKIAPWSKEAKHLESLVMQATGDMHSTNNIDKYIETFKRASEEYWQDHEKDHHSSIKRQLIERPWFPAIVAYFWHQYPTYCLTFLDKFFPETRCLIYGHIHRSGVIRKSNRLIINTGGFDPVSQPHGVIITRDDISLHRIYFQNGQYQLKHKIFHARVTDLAPAKSLKSQAI